MASATLTPDLAKAIDRVLECQEHLDKYNKALNDERPITKEFSNKATDVLKLWQRDKKELDRVVNELEELMKKRLTLETALVELYLEHHHSLEKAYRNRFKV